jgi:hypothetical protein
VSERGKERERRGGVGKDEGAMGRRFWSLEGEGVVGNQGHVRCQREGERLGKHMTGGVHLSVWGEKEKRGRRECVGWAGLLGFCPGLAQVCSISSLFCSDLFLFVFCFMICFITLTFGHQMHSNKFLNFVKFNTTF